ncbi:hypothetical protein R3P38DRAFT_621048 [Favolaschia claudopus]|uniref:Uncharacterized protein n=1 Tax=Favolaschia claudopus TaxID=2862362 RepID=A0AAW0CBZ6_9AGAR
MSVIVTAELIAALLELAFYGSYFILLVTVIYLFRRRHGIPPKKAAAGAAGLLLLGLVVQFLLVTGHTINTTYQALWAVHLGGGTVAAQWYSNLTRPTFIVNLVLMVLTHHLTDAFVLHRLYVIFARERSVMIFPLLCFLTQLVSGTGFIVRAARAGPNDDYLALSNGWLTAKLVASILISSYASVAIARRIWRIQSALQKKSEHMRLTALLSIFVESALLQTAVTIGMLVSFQYKLLAGEFISTGIAPALFGISTVLIHARIGLGWTEEASQASSVSGRVQFPSASGVSWKKDSQVDEERRVESKTSFDSGVGILNTPTQAYMRRA